MTYDERHMTYNYFKKNLLKFVVHFGPFFVRFGIGASIRTILKAVCQTLREETGTPTH